MKSLSGFYCINNTIPFLFNRKFIARRQTPWKLLIQFLKIILVTFQLIVFGSFRYEHTNYYADNDIGFKHLFLKVKIS